MKKKATLEKEKKDIIFHDLLGPITSIKSILYFVLMKIKSSDQETKEYLQQGLKKCDEAIEKVNQLRKNWPAL